MDNIGDDKNPCHVHKQSYLDKLEKIATNLLEKETLYEKDLDFIIFGKEEREENCENS